MSEPFYVRQSGEPNHLACPRDWFEACVAEAKAEGATFSRATISDRHDLLLFEAWYEQPEDQGNPRFSYAA